MHKRKRKDRSSGHTWAKRELLEIEWIDHAGSAGWCSRSEAVERSATRLLCRSIGWKVCENQHTITLASAEATNDDVSQRQYILKKLIVTMRPVHGRYVHLSNR